MPVVRSHWPVVGPGGVVSFTANGGTLVSVHPTDPALARVQVGIDAPHVPRLDLLVGVCQAGVSLNDLVHRLGQGGCRGEGVMLGERQHGLVHDPGLG